MRRREDMTEESKGEAAEAALEAQTSGCDSAAEQGSNARRSRGAAAKASYGQRACATRKSQPV